MRVTKRELMFSTIILFILLALGLAFSDKVQVKAANQTEVYLKAVHITDPGQFQYAADTSLGIALAYGQFEAVTPVSLPELQGSFFYIEQVTERYTEHTRTIKEKDENGNETVRTETYYEWDVKGRSSWQTEEVLFMDTKYPADKFSVSAQRLPISSENASGRIKANYRYNRSPHFPSEGDLRYYYNFVPVTFRGTVLVSLKDGTFQNALAESKPVKVEYEKEITTVVETAKGTGKRWTIIFWIAWILFTAAVIVGFVYLDNRWLEPNR